MPRPRGGGPRGGSPRPGGGGSAGGPHPHEPRRAAAAGGAARAGATVPTQSLGAEWAKYGITVNAVAPGPTETEGVLEVWKTEAMIAQAARAGPLRRAGRPGGGGW